MTYGAIEAGGTKFVCATGTGPQALGRMTRIETTSPEQTLEQVIEFFQSGKASIRALGVGAFGPIDPHPSSATYGRLLQTPKSQWSNVDLLEPLRALGCPIALDTDVNAAALAEYEWGAGADVDSLLYLTVGTGIGGGYVVDGAPLHGLLHPEMGHLRVRRLEHDSFDGLCPYHGDCLEGLASGPALEARTGVRPETLSSDHDVWSLQAQYLARACATLVYALSPGRIVLGGGVMQQHHLFPRIRHHLRDELGGYVNVPALTSGLDSYVVPPGLGKRAGVLGALRLAQQKRPPKPEGPVKAEPSDSPRADASTSESASTELDPAE